MDLTLPDGEPERLSALLETGVLDTAPEPEFDALVWMAARACRAPVALVSLVGAERTFYKARFGLAATGSPRARSFCAAAIAGRDVFVVEDAAADPRFRENPDVSEHGVRFYAGAPILLGGRHAAGTVCVLDVVPRRLGEEERLFLGHLAAQAAILLDLRRLRAEMERKSDLLRAVVEESLDPVYVKDLRGRYVYANEAVERLVGRPASELVGRNVAEVFDEASAREMDEHDRRELATGEVETLEQTVGAGARARVFVTRKGVFRDAAGRPAGLVGVSHDVTARKRLEEKLAWDACHDPLTGLINRAAFLERVGRLLQRSDQGPASLTALLYVDLDGFKEVNDRLGHVAGDAILAAVARRLEQCVRPGDVVGRLGGDEFGVLVGEVDDPSMPETVARRICETLACPMRVVGGDVTVAASVGIAVAEGGEALDLVQKADVALYRAKAAGKGRVEVFTR